MSEISSDLQQFLTPYSPATARRIKPKSRAGKQLPGVPQGRASEHKPYGANIPISDYIIRGFGDSGKPRVSSSRQGMQLPATASSAQANPWKLQRLAASYEPDLNIIDVLMENVTAKLKSKIRNLLSKPPHRDEIEKMKQQLKG